MLQVVSQLSNILLEFKTTISIIGSVLELLVQAIHLAYECLLAMAGRMDCAILAHLFQFAFAGLLDQLLLLVNDLHTFAFHFLVERKVYDRVSHCCNQWWQRLVHRQKE